MKTNQILIVVGVIALILIIVNWSKIFRPIKFARGGVVIINAPYQEEMDYVPNYNYITLQRIARGIVTMTGPGTWNRDL